MILLIPVYLLWGIYTFCSKIGREGSYEVVRRISEQREAHMGEKIRNLRKQLGWTQEELAYRAEIDTSYLGQIERGKRRSPTLRMIGKIADALSVDSSLLLEQPEAEEIQDKEAMTWSDIPERVALELKRRSPNEQLMFYRILQIIQQFLE